MTSSTKFLDLINETNLNNPAYSKPDDFKQKQVIYGTAGFRMKADHLDWIMYRIGMLACLRSICKRSKYIGCMITASHNPKEDNGCKLVDPDGDMLEEKWETYATQLVNSNDLCSTLRKLCETDFKDFLISHDDDDKATAKTAAAANIVIAYDTRPSSLSLLEAFKAGVEALRGSLVNYGLLSTPQLHYMVRCLNTNSAYGEPTESGYFQKITNAFWNVWSMIDQSAGGGKYDRDLFVDGANGIGAMKTRSLAKFLNEKQQSTNVEEIPKLNIHVFNEGLLPGDELNHLVGADYVKVQQKPPNNLPDEVTKRSSSSSSSSSSPQPAKCCSLDGDADRVVYYYQNSNSNNNEFYLLDGDKISTLIATHLKELLENAVGGLSDLLNLCIVQTAYANGSSTDYIQNKMRVNVSCVPTGVKYLHHEAQKADIGVYFEANGHGTILFSPKAEQLIEEAYKTNIESIKEIAEADHATRKKLLMNNKSLSALWNLKHFKDCINQTVGDAISDFLVVELILASRNMSVPEWNSLYTDLPSRQLKVSIKDRTFIRTYDAERRVSQPADLQAALDAAVKETGCASARAFVRPSGTEDVVRVYAEADTQELTDKLAKKCCQLVYDLAGGVGSRP